MICRFDDLMILNQQINKSINQQVIPRGISSAG
jgi:hypothetical protein